MDSKCVGISFALTKLEPSMFKGRGQNLSENILVSVWYEGGSVPDWHIVQRADILGT